MAIVKVTPQMVRQAVEATDWAAQDALTDADIAERVEGDPDAAPLLTEGETAAALICTVRARLGLSQPAFAQRYDIAPGTLEDWEGGRKKPDRTAFAYLRVIAEEPYVVARVLRSGPAE